MSDKTREDFEAWHAAEKVQPLAPYLDTYKNAHTRCRWEGYQAATQHSAARIAELEAEVQALRRDAERYRFLTNDRADYDTRIRIEQIAARLSIRGKGATDAMVDAAIQKATKEQV